ncbi:ATP synthase F1 subunit delta [Estrella lausannensis]|uniref:ATP synthase subunit delta n=1 Tax=Estrella lausannensis TaxID=483423 RepID=A0A0H5DQJ7_9BACT|nr:ATP synthase F1 subunit delta [Estrella lausannensis]CRX38931.1 ATP synthase subunit delta [Estrella lausannensis]
MKNRHRSISNYAKALFSVKGSIEEKAARARNMEEICQAIQSEGRASRFFANPLVLKQDKSAVLKQCNSLIQDPLLDKFLTFLVKKKKIDSLPLVTKEYKRLLLAECGKEKATVIVAAPIDSPTEKKISDKLESLFSKKMEISLKIDPKILGGFILITSGKILDLSIKQSLNRLSDSLCAVKF